MKTYVFLLFLFFELLGSFQYLFTKICVIKLDEVYVDQLIDENTIYIHTYVCVFTQNGFVLDEHYECDLSNFFPSYFLPLFMDVLLVD